MSDRNQQQQQQQQRRRDQELELQDLDVPEGASSQVTGGAIPITKQVDKASPVLMQNCSAS